MKETAKWFEYCCPFRYKITHFKKRNSTNNRSAMQFSLWQIFWHLATKYGSKQLLFYIKHSSKQSSQSSWVPVSLNFFFASLQTAKFWHHKYSVHSYIASLLSLQIWLCYLCNGERSWACNAGTKLTRLTNITLIRDKNRPGYWRTQYL